MQGSFAGGGREDGTDNEVFLRPRKALLRLVLPSSCHFGYHPQTLAMTQDSIPVA